ncbi:MAG: hypothetical protein M1442_00235 [Candidatus Thermoplasmatota archaeon]|jgi:hypothetical protein|nr:hypothetical protein [Candidatus Thermoplasmatota archaeon]
MKTGYGIPITVDGLQLLSVRSEPTRDGRVFFIPTKGRNIHLTFYSKQGRINLHLKDCEKMPPKIWEANVLITSELAEKLARRVKRNIVRYHGNEKFYIFGPRMRYLLQSMHQTFSDPSNDGNGIDFIQFYNAFMSDLNGSDDLERIRIREAWNAGIKFGLAFSKTQAYVIYPIDKQHYLRINMDMSRNFFGVVPMGKAISAWMKHLEREGILDMIFEPIKEQVMAKIQKMNSVFNSDRSLNT